MIVDEYGESHVFWLYTLIGVTGNDAEQDANQGEEDEEDEIEFIFWDMSFGEREACK